MSPSNDMRGAGSENVESSEVFLVSSLRASLVVPDSNVGVNSESTLCQDIRMSPYNQINTAARRITLPNKGTALILVSGDRGVNKPGVSD